MSIRTRTLYGPYPQGGNATYHWQPFFPDDHFHQDATSWLPIFGQVTTDEDAGDKHTPNGFATSNYLKQIYPMNGKIDNAVFPNLGMEYINWLPTGIVEYPIGHLADTGIPNLADAQNTLVTRTQPGRPTVNVPREIAELRDIPHMIRQGGDLLRRFNRSSGSPRDIARYLAGLQAARDGAGIYLGWEFGISPIVSDVRKLMQFNRLVGQRFKELQRLQSKRGLKRRFTLYKNTVQEDKNVSIESSAGILVETPCTTITTTELWGTVRYTPGPATLPPWIESKDNEIRAREMVLGLGLPDAGDAWDVLPWTWLIDWTSNISAYLHANLGNNRCPVIAHDMCLMTHRQTDISFDPVTRFGLQKQKSSIKYETKERSVRGPDTSGLSIEIPALTGSQLAILGSLAVTHGRGSHNL